MEVKPMPVGIDSYCLVSQDLNSFEILQWTKARGGAGVQFTALPEYSEPGQEIDLGFLRELGEFARAENMYIEWGRARHIPFDLSSGCWQPVLDSIITAVLEAKELGATVVRSCSGGLMRWHNRLPATEVMLEEMVEQLRQAVPILQDHGVTLAIETHFEFTTFELLRVFEQVGVNPGEGLGICLDTMNLLTMLENPVWATRRVLPWVVATHAKDGCIRLHEEGFETFTTPIGRGSVDWQAIIPMLARLTPGVKLSIEDHGGSFVLPYFRSTFLSRFPDLTVQELASLQQLAMETEIRIQRGEVAPVERANWSEICQVRVTENIKNLKEIQEQVLGATLPG